MNDHKAIFKKTVTRLEEDPYKITSEFLNDADTELTCFFFNRGANFYVFSYNNNGIRRHTMVDTGDPMYRDRILSILTNHNINPEHIDRVIITHRHHDHCGLADLLARISGAKILVHSNFRNFIEGPLSEEDRMWLRGFDPSRLRQCKVEYLSPLEGNPSAVIDGLNFPILSGLIPIGDTGHLEILTCPESTTMHSPDQIIVRYIPKSLHDIKENIQGDGRPVGHILFSGDLWLMHGPLFSKSFRAFSLRLRMASYQVKSILSGKKWPRRDPRLQDIRAKEALKHGFSLIRVMPGHGEDFIGTRMIPLCFLCDRDLLVELGYSIDEKKSILRSGDLVQQVKTLRENTYAGFIRELLLWQASGYSQKEMSDFLIRIYQEQHGGGPLVKEDRRERRGRIEETLTSLSHEENVDMELKVLAESTLAGIERRS